MGEQAAKIGKKLLKRLYKLLDKLVVTPISSVVFKIQKRFGKENSLENIVQKSKKYDKIILATYNTSKDSFSKQLYDALDKSNLICVSLRSPFDIIHLQGCKTYLCTFDCTKESLIALSESLRANKFSTKLPINLKK